MLAEIKASALTVPKKLPWFSSSAPPVNSSSSSSFQFGAVPEAINPDFYLVIPDSEDDYLIASAKRSIESHELFGNELEKSERLIEDFSCAWMKEILIHGRLYIFEKHLAFYSRIIWTFKLVIPFESIKVIEKKSVAGVFQNVVILIITIRLLKL